MTGEGLGPSAGRHRKAEAEGGADARKAFDIEPAAVKLHDALGDGQAQTGTLPPIAAILGDPKYWRIVGAKLYLNYDASVQRAWERDIPGFIRKADGNWPKVLE